MYFSRGKVITIFVVCILGILFALPNALSKAELAKMPGWLPHRQINLGLDLKGGAYLLLQLDLDAMRKEQIDTTVDALRNQLRTDKIGFTTLEGRGDNDIHLVLRDPAQLHDALTSIDKTEGFVPDAAGGDGAFTVSTGSDNQTIDAKLTDHALDERASKAVEQSIEIVRRRIDQLGVTEPQIAKQGNDRILVQLPGVEDPDRVKTILGTTAKMNFQLLDDAADPASGHAPPGDDILPGDDKDASGKPRLFVVKKKIEVSGRRPDGRAGSNGW